MLFNVSCQTILQTKELFACFKCLTFSFSIVRVIFAWSSSNAVCTAAVSLPVKIIVILIIAVRTQIILEITRSQSRTGAILGDLHIVQGNITSIGVATNSFEYQLQGKNTLPFYYKRFSIAVYYLYITIIIISIITNTALTKMNIITNHQHNYYYQQHILQ